MAAFLVGPSLRPVSPNPPPSFAPLVSSPLAHNLPSPPPTPFYDLDSQIGSEATPSLPSSELAMEDTMMTDEDEGSFTMRAQGPSSSSSEVDGEETMLHSDEPLPPSASSSGDPPKSSFLSPPVFGFHQSTGSSSPGPSWLPGLQGAGTAGPFGGAGGGFEAAARRKRAIGYKQRPAASAGGSGDRRYIPTPPSSSSSLPRSSSPSPGPSAVLSSKAYSRRSPPSLFPGIDASAPSSETAARLRSLAAEQFRSSRRKERLTASGSRRQLDMYWSDEGHDRWDDEDEMVLGMMSKRSVKQDWRGWGLREGERGWGSSPGGSAWGDPDEEFEEEVLDQEQEEVPSDIEADFAEQSAPQVRLDVTPADDDDELFFDDIDDAALAALELPSSSGATVVASSRPEASQADEMVA